MLLSWMYLNFIVVHSFKDPEVIRKVVPFLLMGIKDSAPLVKKKTITVVTRILPLVLQVKILKYLKCLLIMSWDVISYGFWFLPRTDHCLGLVLYCALSPILFLALHHCEDVHLCVWFVTACMRDKVGSSRDSRNVGGKYLSKWSVWKYLRPFVGCDVELQHCHHGQSGHDDPSVKIAFKLFHVCYVLH